MVVTFFGPLRVSESKSMRRKAATIEKVIESPYIMCVQYRGGVQYRGDIMSTVGGYLEYRGGYHDKCGDILSNLGGVQYRVGIS